MIITKKAVSGIITAILITLLSISLVYIVYYFTKGTLSNTTTDAEMKIYAISNIALKISNVYLYGNNLYIVVENKGQQDITSFAVRVTSKNDIIYLNTSVHLPNEEKLGPLNTRSLIIIPAPFGNYSGNYSLVEVYPKFDFKGKEEIAENAKVEVKGESFGIGDGKENINPVPSEDNFIFTFFPAYIYSQDNDAWRKQTIDKAMEAGMTHAAVLFSDASNQTNVQYYLEYMRNKRYKVAIGFVSSWPLSFFSTGKAGDKLLNASCLNITNCKNWNGTYSINPAYEGISWNQTLIRINNMTRIASPDVVYFDVETFSDPSNVEWYYKSAPCNCEIIKQSIGYTAYNTGWLKKGKEMNNAIKEVNSNISVYFYLEMPKGGSKLNQDYRGNYINYNSSGYWLSGSGDGAGTSLYDLPNLEIFEKNMQTLNLQNALPWISFTYLNGYSSYKAGDVRFDTSVSREAGRLLRKAGAKGFAVYPSLTEVSNSSYWTSHVKEMIAGFKEGLTYIETNKIKNPGFEAFKTKADGYNPVSYTLTGDIRFIPVFWNFTDTRIFSDNSSFAGLSSTDKVSGVYSWRQTMKGIGNRTITSKEFIIEQGNYKFSIYLKSSMPSNNPTAEFFIGNEKIGESEITNSWSLFEKTFSLNDGTKTLKIILKDTSAGNKDILIDNISLIKS